MDHFYTFILFLHILSAIGSIGPLFVIFLVLKQLETTDTSDELPVLRVIKGSVQLIKHSGHVLVGSGILLIVFGFWRWNDSWIVATLALMVLSIVFLASAFKSVFRAYEAGTMERSMFLSRLFRSTALYAVLLLAMLALMVFKPVLW